MVRATSKTNDKEKMLVGSPLKDKTAEKWRESVYEKPAQGQKGRKIEEKCL